jgi:hypothetical protein
MTQAFNLSQLANKVNSSGQLDGATGLTGTITSSALSITGNSNLATSSGSVGIGTASPTSQLAVQTTAGSSLGFLKFTDITYGGDVRFGKNTGISNDAILGTWVANNMLFYTSGAEAMRVDSGGNVGIGTTSPGVKLEIHQGAAGSRASLCVHSSSSATTDGIIYSYTNTSSGTGFVHIAAQSLGAVVFKVLGNGNVQNANNSYGSTSDIKLKENIVDATPKLDDLMKVKVRHYNFIDDESKTKQIGVVAQEVEQVFSGIVENISDRDEEGNTLDSVTKSVKYSVFVPMLIKAIQEQQTIINDLKTRIETLELK